MKITLSKPFGYVGVSMLQKRDNYYANTFMGCDKRLDRTDTPLYTLSQIRWLLGSNGIEVEIKEGD